ncbi:MAG: hypothetical protein J6A08_13915 [Lachnospiraceae bacterium]|nr:hypothetical protein [Lachnospiraceae bacterium]
MKIKKNTFLLSLICIGALISSCGTDLPSSPSDKSDSTTLSAAESEEASAIPAVRAADSYLRASDIVLDLNSPGLQPSAESEVPVNSCGDLSVPTYLTKVDDTYFIVDCYHNQIIYHDNLSDPLYEWQVMTSEIDKGHTLASDGMVYLIDDTENNRILIFEKKDGVFYHTQTFDEIGNRPHYIIYNEATDTFYAWSSMSGEMYLFRHDPGDSRMYLTEIRRIDALSDTYVRSFTIMDDSIYFVSGIPGSPAILEADLNTFEIRNTYSVPDTMAGMIQLTKIENHYYITISTDSNGNQDYATIIRTDDLSTLSAGNYEDIYKYFIGGGTPYYITQIDNSYYLTEHRIPGHSIWRFRIANGEIMDVETIY